jgi:hypothetical protein
LDRGQEEEGERIISRREIKSNESMERAYLLDADIEFQGTRGVLVIIYYPVLHGQ